jgi:antibiotic biosynthesis monooxygenase (ABM) superfamily enzyme
MVLVRLEETRHVSHATHLRILILSKSFYMIINTLNDKRRLASAFSKYISQDAKFQSKFHVVATMAGFKNWEELIGLLRDPDIQDAIRGVESFFENETKEAIHEGIHAWLEYMLIEDGLENFNSYDLLKIIVLYYFLIRNEDFMAFYSEIEDIGLMDIAEVPLLTGYNIWSYPDMTALMKLHAFFEDDPSFYIEHQSPVDACRHLRYLAVTLPDGIKLMQWEAKQSKNVFINEHIYSYEHGQSYYLKFYGGNPDLLVCDDVYPEGLDALCKSLGILYAGEIPLPYMGSAELYRLGMKKGVMLAEEIT